LELTKLTKLTKAFYNPLIAPYSPFITFYNFLFLFFLVFYNFLFFYLNGRGLFNPPSINTLRCFIFYFFILSVGILWVWREKYPKGRQTQRDSSEGGFCNAGAMQLQCKCSADVEGYKGL
jgi:hypothetical protein